VPTSTNYYKNRITNKKQSHSKIQISLKRICWHRQLTMYTLLSYKIQAIKVVDQYKNQSWLLVDLHSLRSISRWGKTWQRKSPK
jgi:hypothetical protein